MLFDLLGVALSSSQTSLGIPPQQLQEMLNVTLRVNKVGVRNRGDRVHVTHPPHDGDGLGGEEPRVAHLVVHDAVKNLLFVIAGKRRL